MLPGEGLHGRIIPARAGFTSRRRRSPTAARDHPRSRGVYLVFEPVRHQYRGSSPLARGLRRLGPFRQVAARIIPARAGFTDLLRVYGVDLLDHPRSRGVYDPLPGWACEALGSSPLARGLRHPCRPGPRATRIIPARAGFTLFSFLAWASHSGSSPLARGLRAFTGAMHALIADHPRSRGVYTR